MTLAEAENLALTVLKQVMEEKLTADNVEIAAVRTSTKQFHLYNKIEVEEAIGKLQ